MNRRQNEFAWKMLQEVLAFLEFPMEDTKVLQFSPCGKQDKTLMVVTDGEQDLLFAECLVWDAQDEFQDDGTAYGMTCGGIVVEIPYPEETLSFSFRNGKFSVMEVVGNA